MSKTFPPRLAHAHRAANARTFFSELEKRPGWASMATTEKERPALDMTVGESFARACHKNLWEYFGWVERLLPNNAIGLQKALYVLRHPGTTRHERATAAADAISAIVAVRALLDTKPKTDPVAATLRDFDPAACACIRQLAQELTEYAVPAMLPPSEQEAADLRLALLLAADMPPALDAHQPVGQSYQGALVGMPTPPPLALAPQNMEPAGNTKFMLPAHGRGGSHPWLAALANDLLDEYGDREESCSESEDGGEDGVKPSQLGGKKEIE